MPSVRFRLPDKFPLLGRQTDCRVALSPLMGGMDEMEAEEWEVFSADEAGPPAMAVQQIRVWGGSTPRNP